MARYIDLDRINPWRCPRSIAQVREWLFDLPVEDVKPVIHAHWEPHEELEDCAYCSNCNVGLLKHFWVRPFDWDYCPNCGAKMDEEADNGEVY